MRAREFILKEANVGAVSTDPQATAGTPVDPNAPDDQKVQQLSASISGLQKQIQTLQKAALQSAPAAAPGAVAPGAAQPAPPPGQNSQQQVPKGTVGTGTGNSTLQQQQQAAKPGTPMGQPGVAGAATDANKPAPGQPAAPGTPPAPGQPPAPPGVTQSPQMIKLNLQKQLAKTQASGL